MSKGRGALLVAGLIAVMVLLSLLLDTTLPR